MWRKRGQLVSYMYLPEREAACGVDWKWRAGANSGFKEVRVYNKMNDPGAPATCSSAPVCASLCLRQRSCGVTGATAAARPAALHAESCVYSVCIVGAACTPRIERPPHLLMGLRVYAGQANGVQRAWVDAALVLDRGDILFSSDGSNMIEKFLLHNFHGGNDERFAPPRYQSIWCAALLYLHGVCCCMVCVACCLRQVSAPDAASPRKQQQNGVLSGKLTCRASADRSCHSGKARNRGAALPCAPSSIARAPF